MCGTNPTMDGLFSSLFHVVYKKKASVKLKEEQKIGHAVRVPVHQGCYPIFEINQ